MESLKEWHDSWQVYIDNTTLYVNGAGCASILAGFDVEGATHRISDKIVSMHFYDVLNLHVWIHNIKHKKLKKTWTVFKTEFQKSWNWNNAYIDISRLKLKYVVLTSVN